MIFWLIKLINVFAIELINQEPLINQIFDHQGSDKFCFEEWKEQVKQ